MWSFGCDDDDDCEWRWWWYCEIGHGEVRNEFSRIGDSRQEKGINRWLVEISSIVFRHSIHTRVRISYRFASKDEIPELILNQFNMNLLTSRISAPRLCPPPMTSLKCFRNSCCVINGKNPAPLLLINIHILKFLMVLHFFSSFFSRLHGKVNLDIREVELTMDMDRRRGRKNIRIFFVY